MSPMKKKTQKKKAMPKPASPKPRYGYSVNAIKTLRGVRK